MSEAKLRAIAGEARIRTEEKSAIVAKLEQVIKLTHTIRAIGNVVKEVSYWLSTIQRRNSPRSTRYVAAPCRRDSLDCHRAADNGLLFFSLARREAYVYYLGLRGAGRMPQSSAWPRRGP